MEEISGEAIRPWGLTWGHFLDSLINLLLHDRSHKGFILLSGDEGGDMLSDSLMVGVLSKGGSERSSL
jgi:hypothetical protein